MKRRRGLHQALKLKRQTEAEDEEEYLSLFQSPFDVTSCGTRSARIYLFGIPASLAPPRQSLPPSSPLTPSPPLTHRHPHPLAVQRRCLCHCVNCGPPPTSSYGLVWVGCVLLPSLLDRLSGLVVKASASGAEDPGFESRLRRDVSGSSHTSDFKIDTPVAMPCQAPGVIGSALGLVGPVSVCCDWMRWKVESATSVSM